MQAINRKLVRDLWQMKWQALAIAAVIGCGVATFVMSLSTYYSLETTQRTYYEKHRFAHIFCSLKRAPNYVAKKLEVIPGVAQVQTRVVQMVTLDVEDMVEPAMGRLISIPEKSKPRLNDLYMRKGRYIVPRRTGEVLASEGFVKAHRLEPGDSVTAIINGRKKKLTIVGVVLSPEYIYAIRPGDILPDNKSFGIFWMGYTDLAAAFDMEGAFNDVALTLTPNAIPDEVIQRVDRILKQYGGLGAYTRDDQMSHKFISNELNQLWAMAIIMPCVFLGVSAFLLNVVLTRLISTQRDQIAALKAFGYYNWQVGDHYLRLVFLVVVVGVVFGTLTGIWLGVQVTQLYTKFFHFPIFRFDLNIGVIGLGLLISAGAAALGTLAAIRRAVHLPPAEAMRPEPPPTFKRTILERIGLEKLVPPIARMILRQLERQPVKSLMSCIGIALATSILVVGNFSEDVVNHLMETQFQFAQRHDMTIAFVEPTSPGVINEIKHLKGVIHSETFRSAPVRIRHGHRTRRLGIMGQEMDSKLNRLMDIYRNPSTLPPDGLVVSQTLANALKLNVGDVVRVEVLEGKRPVRNLPVVGTIDDFSGMTAYMNRDALNRMLREDTVISGAYLSVDERYTDDLYQILQNMPRVAGVTVKSTALQSFRDTVAENLLVMKVFNVIFATVIAFGVVYNNARISFSERSRELATLRVIGFTRTEISLIFLGEQAILTLIAIPAGLVMGYGLAGLVVEAQDTELFRMPLIVSSHTYAFATTVVLIAAMISGLIVRRMLDHLDLVAVLKTKE